MELYFKNADGTVSVVTAATPLPTTGGGGGGGDASAANQVLQLAATKAVETTITPTQVTLTAATSGTLKTATANRIRFIIDNPLSAILYVRKAASAASASAYDIAIPAGGSYLSDQYEWAGEIRAFSTPGGIVNFSESV